MQIKKSLFLFPLMVNAISVQAYNPFQNFTLSGFASAGIAVTNAVNTDFYDPIFGQKITTVPTYFEVGQKPVAETDTLGGLQFNLNLPNPNASIIIQAVAAGAIDNFNFRADWAYFNYKFNDFIAVRVGRIVAPTLLFSDYADIRYAFPWFRAPSVLYNNSTTDNFNGLAIDFTEYVTQNWLAEVTITGGSNNYFDLTESIGGGAEIRLSNEYLTVRAFYNMGTNTQRSFPQEITFIQTLIGQPCTGYQQFFDVRNPSTALGGQCDVYLTSDADAYLLSAGVVGDPLFANDFTIKNALIGFTSASYDLHWNQFRSIAEMMYYNNDSFIAADVFAWYASVGYTFAPINTMVMFTFQQTRTLKNNKRTVYEDALDFVNPFRVAVPGNIPGFPLPIGVTQAESVNTFLELLNPAQKSYSVDLRWDAMDSVAFKAQIQWIDPQDRLGVGLFSLPPGKMVTQVGVGVDAVF